MKVARTINAVDRMFRAFADPNRLRILHLLHANEFCVGDIVSALDVPQPRISRHLAYLRTAGLVQVRKEGLWSFYSLTAAKNAFHRNLLSCLGCCFADVPQLRADAKRAGILKQTTGDCCPK